MFANYEMTKIQELQNRFHNCTNKRQELYELSINDFIICLRAFDSSRSMSRQLYLDDNHLRDLIKKIFYPLNVYEIKAPFNNGETHALLFPYMRCTIGEYLYITTRNKPLFLARTRFIDAVNNNQTAYKVTSELTLMGVILNTEELLKLARLFFPPTPENNYLYCATEFRKTPSSLLTIVTNTLTNAEDTPTGPDFAIFTYSRSGRMWLRGTNVLMDNPATLNDLELDLIADDLEEGLQDEPFEEIRPVML